MGNPKINIIVKELGRIDMRSKAFSYKASLQKKYDDKLLNKIAAVIVEHQQNPDKYKDYETDKI